MLRYILICLMIFTGAMAYPLRAAAPEDTYGVTKNIPVYMQEWHIWWGFPYPNKSASFSHMETTMTSFREPWRLQWNRNGYPFVGLYDSRNLDIVRWQMRCIKATGVTSVAVQIHPSNEDGITFIQEQFGFLKQLLDIAAEEHFPIFFMDEVAFRNGDKPRDPVLMAKRVARFIDMYGRHPGFYKVDGKPMYYYQTFGYWVGAPATQKMMEQAEAEAGPIYWMVFGGVDQVGAVAKVNAIICGANIERRNQATRQLDLRNQDPEGIFPAARKFNKKIGDIHYPKFDGTAQPWRQQDVALYGQGGDYLKTTVSASMKAKPDLLMLASWNDYEEGACLEPSWDFDGFVGDPYQYCRVIANLRGVEFVPPAVPPKEALHPSIWEKLGYGDGAGPIIEAARRSHVRGGSLEVVVRDSASAVQGLEVVWNGDAWWQAPQRGQQAPTGNLQLAAGGVDKGQAVPGTLGFQAGYAASVKSPQLTFRAAGDNQLGSTPAVGVIYAFDPNDPLKPVRATMQREFPAELSEPAGTKQQEVLLPLSPSNKPEEIGDDVWHGWQVRQAVPYTPIVADTSGNLLKLDAGGTRLAQVSLLGPPNESRLATTQPVAHDPAGYRVSYYLPLGPEQLERPGIHALWLRARDKAGNWGSPRLYAIPNFEEVEKSSGTAVQPGFVAPQDALLADPLISTARWRHVDVAGGKIERYKQVTSRACLSLDNCVYESPLKQTLDGSFTVKFKMLHGNWERGGILWIAGDKGRGYGVLWDSAQPAAFDGQGHISILKLDQETPPRWNSVGQRIGEVASSGHAATDMPMADFVFSYDAATGQLAVAVDGKQVATATDQSFRRFDRIYLRGNERVLFSDLIVTAGK